MAGLADAGILFPAIPDGILLPPDYAGMLFPANLAKPVTVGVAGLADAGILFPAVSEGIPFPTEPAEMLLPADDIEPCTVGVTDLDAAGTAALTGPDELPELGDEVESFPGGYGGDGYDFGILWKWRRSWDAGI